jgi:hypothetical protein
MESPTFYFQLPNMLIQELTFAFYLFSLSLQQGLLFVFMASAIIYATSCPLTPKY